MPLKVSPWANPLARVVQAALAMVVLLLGNALAAPPAYVAGKHYQVLGTPVETRNRAKIEVVEVFSYGCPHCFHFEPQVTAWRARQAADVDFVHVPAVFNAQFRTLGQAFYTAQALKVLERTHTPMFKALHEQNRPLWLNTELARFYAGHGVKEEDFTRAFNSFGVRAGIQRSEMLTRSYQISGVPAMVVNGKYVVDGRMAGTNDAMLLVVDYLVARERAARRAAPAAASTRPAARASR